MCRHRSGILYLNAKVAGKKVRISLQTDNLKVAKAKRDEKLAQLRAAADRGMSDFATIGDALTFVENRLRGNADLKESTREFSPVPFPDRRTCQ